MDPTRFDAFARRVAATRSRRGLLQALAGAAVAAALPAGALADNSACAQFCRQLPPGAARGRCASDAAHGVGLCYQCGPAAGDTGQQLCGGVCKGAANAPCTTNGQCCSDICAPGVGCCPTCPTGCACALARDQGLVCTTGQGSRHNCSLVNLPCPTGEACIDDICLAVCASAA